MARQVEATAADTVDLDDAPHSFAFSLQGDRHLEPATRRLHLGVDAGSRRHGSEQLLVAPGARRRGQREHRHCLQQVGLALPVRTHENVHAGSRLQVEVCVVAVVVQF